MKKIFVLILILVLIGCAKEEIQPEQLPLQEIEIVKSEFPDKPEYEPPPGAPDVEDENTT